METEHLQCSIDSQDFLANFATIKQLWEDDIPIDCLSFHCEDCEKSVHLNENGVIVLDKEISTNMDTVMRQLESDMVGEHITNSNLGCTGKKLGVPAIGFATNLLFIFPCSDNDKLTAFKVMDCEYVVDILVTTSEEPQKCFLALYRRSDGQDSTYHQFICGNFSTQLDVDKDEQEDIILESEESVNRFRSLLPRLKGKFLPTMGLTSKGQQLLIF